MTYNFTQAIDIVERAVGEAILLRFDTDSPTFDADPAEILATLQDVRRRLDRGEELYANSMRIKNRVERDKALTQAVADDAWDAAINTARTDRRTVAVLNTRDEFSSAKERTAEANLATVEHRRKARIAADAYTAVTGHVDVLRTLHRGLDNVRHDLLATLRTLAFESTLDR